MTEMLDRTAVKVMTAKFAGRCPNCQEPIAAGSRIQYHMESRKAFHVGCELTIRPAARPDPVMPAAIPMNARFAGRCASCREPIEVGDPIKYARPNAFHALCEVAVAQEIDQTELDLSVLPYGTSRYAAEDAKGVLRFIKVDAIKPDAERWAGNVYVKEQRGGGTGHRLGRQVVGGKYVGDYADVLAKVLEGPEAAAIRYGMELGKCAICNADLTDPESRAHGIGPKCRKRFSWTGPKPAFDIEGEVD